MDYSGYCCLNRACRDCGEFGLGNITLKERYGRKATMLLLCRTCGRTFSENRGTPFFKLRISYEQLYQILTTLVQCGSIRGTAKVVGVSTNTVLRVIRIAGMHAKEFNDFTLQGLKMSQVQVDELWTFIKKRRVRQPVKARSTP